MLWLEGGWREGGASWLAGSGGAAHARLHAVLHAPPSSPHTATKTLAAPVCVSACRCLAYRQEDRMDVHAAAAHPYMSFKKPAKAAPTPAKELAPATAAPAATAAAATS